MKQVTTEKQALVKKIAVQPWTVFWNSDSYFYFIRDCNQCLVFLGMSYFDVEEEEKKFHEKHPPCYGVKKEFIDCIIQSDCFLKVIIRFT